MSWKEAFCKQAESDYTMFEQLNRLKTPGSVCHQLHYLQMSTEKLAKAFSCPPGGAPPRTTHAALARFLRISKGLPKLREQLGYGGSRNYNAFVSYIDSLLPFAEKIESLAPEGRRLDKPNPEYPWKSQAGDVIAPIDHPFREIWSDVTSMNKLRNLMVNLMRIAKV